MPHIKGSPKEEEKEPSRKLPQRRRAEIVEKDIPMQRLKEPKAKSG